MAISSDHAMTWNFGSTRIPRKGLPDSLRAFASDEVTKKLVGGYLAFWNKEKATIDFFLEIRHFSLLIIHFSLENSALFPSRHAIKIETLLVYHRFGMKIFLFSFFEKSTLIEQSHFNKRLKIFGRKFPFRPILFIFEIMFSFFK